jgi:lipid II:glycine glycyltransferase (peptidoglycan interpeptide bridge formation enzyme)
MGMIQITEAAAHDCDDRAATFLQSGFWATFKSEFGWKSRYFRVGSDAAPLTVLSRRLARGVSFAYVPRGPAVDDPQEGRTEYLASVAEALKPLLSRSCVFLRFDPPWFSKRSPETQYDPAARPFLGKPFCRAAVDIQPPDTAVLFLYGRTDEEILTGMKPKWRYNIRLAEKKGVTVSAEPADKAIDIFYSLYKTTAARDRIALHPKHYYARLLALSAEYGASSPDIRVWIARHEGKPLAAIITSFRRDEAVYLYGASSDEQRNLMPAYALQWAAIRAARDAGCKYYDFYGMPPAEDPNHPMAGLYRFKTGFGGEVFHYAGSWDYPLRPVLYNGYRLAEALRGFWFKTARKRLAPRGNGG